MVILFALTLHKPLLLGSGFMTENAPSGDHHRFAHVLFWSLFKIEPIPVGTIGLNTRSNIRLGEVENTCGQA